jgi:hypothetical protein
VEPGKDTHIELTAANVRPLTQIETQAA